MYRLTSPVLRRGPIPRRNSPTLQSLQFPEAQQRFPPCRRLTYHPEQRGQHGRSQPRWHQKPASWITIGLGLGATISYLIGAFLRHRTPVLQSTKEPLQTKPAYAERAGLINAVSHLRVVLGDDSVSTDKEELQRHGFSEWSSINIDTLPVAIVYPKDTREVSVIAQTCTKYKIPMVPYSGGSSVEGNFSAPYGGICIDLAFMDKILALHENDLDVVVQPGIGWMDLNSQISSSGLFFPVDPGPSAMIGGMVGTSCSGTNAVRYGTMRENVVNVTVVLADGTVIKTKNRPRKSAAGYNLTGLLVGSEGTLGIVTEITLKLQPQPQDTSVALIPFASVRSAASAAIEIIKAGIQVGAMEIMDDVQMDVVNRAGATNRPWKAVPTMFLKFAGTKGCNTEAIDMVEAITLRNHGGKIEFASTPQEQHELWSARKQALWSMLSLRTSNEEVWATDVAVPLSRLPDIIEVSKKEMDELGLFASILGHIGDGNFHESIMYDASDPKEREKVEGCVRRMVTRALEMEGTCTGEHAIGIGKKNQLVEELGLDTIYMMKRLKASLDPHWIMNPGKIFDHPLEDYVVGH